jgi:uncharacterized protein YjbJ (UPF0337 family)
MYPAAPPPPSWPVVRGVIGFSADGASIFLAAAIATLRLVNGNKAPGPDVGKARSQAMETIMNWDRVEGDWKQIKGKVQQQWGKLTNDDMDVIEGNRTELLGAIQKRYGVAKDEAERQIDTWMKNFN